MTLYRQLLIFTLILFALLVVGIWAEKLHSTRSFLLAQLESHAQDTATSLGLSLSPIMADGDMATVDTMINAVFDRGYYRIIRLEDMQGKVITARELNVEIAGVPGWFVRRVAITAPSAEALVMAGWTQAGKLSIESHPGYAYQTMWETMVRISSYFLIAGALVLLVGGLVLRLLLKPLKRVEMQAEAICRREYQIQENLPRTRELRQVVDSMNRMTMQVRDMFAEQSKVAESLRRKAYSDQLTGLGNRRYLTAQVEARLEAATGMMHGALLIVQMQDLKTINDQAGFDAGDTLLLQVADILKQETLVLNDVALARLTGGDFAIFVSAINPADATVLAENLSQKISRLAVESISHSENLSNIGGVTFEHAPALPKLLSEADIALQAARRKGANTWLVTALSSEEDRVVRGKTWWRETLAEILEKNAILLFTQPVVSSGDHRQVVHHELLSRIEIQSGEIVGADVFVPLAERLQLVPRLDRVVLNKVFAGQQALSSLATIAVNISPSSLNDPEFVAWIVRELQQRSGAFPHVIFEFSEFGAVQYLDMVKDFSQKIQALGHGIGLDHFGQSFANFGYLQSLRPEYVKIDRVFTRELTRDQGDSEFFIRALCGVARSLDIRVVAEGVERDEQLELFMELKIDALQGYLFGAPQRL